MLRTRVIPCLLLRNRGLVKTREFKNPNYVGDPINTIRIFNEKEVDELILLDITATADGKRPNFSLIREVASECFMPLTYGGGVRTLEDARTIFSLGVEKIAVNTQAGLDPSFIGTLAASFGSQSIVASIDVKINWLGQYRVQTHAGRRATGSDPVAWAKQMAAAGAGEVLLTAIDRDGTYGGFDIELIRSVTAVVAVPVIACGGAAGIPDLQKAVCEGGASAVAAGSMVVYQGKNRGVLINFPAREDLEAALP